MMKRKLILNGAALSPAVAGDRYGGKPVINQQPGCCRRMSRQPRYDASIESPLPILPQRSSAAATARRR